jgi:hypothetical protein
MPVGPIARIDGHAVLEIALAHAVARTVLALPAHKKN